MAERPGAAATVDPVPRRQQTTMMRMLDWRFLVPAPAHGTFERLVLLGGPDELAQCIVELGVAQHVSRTVPDGRSADALICLHGAREDVAAAAACLAPGGVLYAEFDGARSRMRAALARAGLTQVRLYWCAPDCTRREAYVPLSTPGAARWYLATVFRGRSRAQELVGAGLRLLSRTRRTVPARFHAVTAVAGAAPARAPSLIADRRLPPELQRADLDVVVLTRRSRRVILFPFATDGTRPLAVLKVSRSADRNAITEREQAVLAAVRALLDARMRRSIPEPLGCFALRDLLVGVESSRDGRRLSIRNGSWLASARRQAADLDAAVNWVTDFHRQAQVGAVRWRDSSGPHELASSLGAYEGLFPVTTAEQQLFAAARRRSDELLAARIPLVWTHGDLGSGNMNWTAEGLSVLDWASAREGLPLLDLLYCVTRWIRTARHSYDEAGAMRVCRDLFLAGGTDDVLVRTARTGIERYTQALKLDARFVPLFAVLLWTGHAVHKSQRARESERDPADLVSARLFASHVRALAAEPARLFGAAHAVSTPGVQ